MESIVLEAKERDEKFYETYRTVFARCSRQYTHRLKNSHTDMWFGIPHAVIGRPPFDEKEMARLVARTFQKKGYFAEATDLDNGSAAVYVNWGHDVVALAKERVFHELVKKCNAAIETYVHSQVYKSTRICKFRYRVPPHVLGEEPYDVQAAAAFCAVALSRDGFQIEFGVDQGQPVLDVSWDYPR